MRTSVHQKLGQHLALTPQLTQSLKLLAMNAVELDHYIEQLLETNPLLEAEERGGGEELLSLEEAADEPLPVGGSGDDRWETLYRYGGGGFDEEREAQIRREQSLSESLHEQIDREPMQEDARAIAHMLIDSLDEDGYYRDDGAALAEAAGTTPERVHAVLEEVVHQLEPAGIGARDPLECLLLQLGERAVDGWARRLLLDAADHLMDPDETLAGRVGLTPQQVAAARARLKRLDPFPGHGMRGHAPVYIKPELIFRINAQREIEVEVPDSGWRGITINDRWQGRKWQGADRAFMDAARNEAKWLLYALEQRKESLLKVGLVLARRQRAFLEYGMIGIKPLTLQDVAEEVGLHESTVSRVTNGKYAQTPIGLIDMRRFFSPGLPTRGGGSISVYRVMQRIRALIASEPPDRPISDQAMAERLQAEGIEIARRTVAKYREQMGLPTSSQRKRARARSPA
ncbi:MAG: RNA polymerase sigma-54 factor [Zetaproteobacteria bacterium]|nr:MAG: RNA polymerase sigma-54 factor [Zetaproteobacteria bacterium]